MIPPHPNHRRHYPAKPINIISYPYPNHRRNKQIHFQAKCCPRRLRSPHDRGCKGDDEANQSGNREEEHGLLGDGAAGADIIIWRDFFILSGGSSSAWRRCRGSCGGIVGGIFGLILGSILSIIHDNFIHISLTTVSSRLRRRRRRDSQKRTCP
jgi:hypothetical protein